MFKVWFLALLTLSASGLNSSKKEENKQDQKYYESLPNKDCAVHYDHKNGKCAWQNEETQKYEPPALDYEPFGDIKCLGDFHNRIFTHVCGDPFYEQIKYCAKVKLYKNKKPEAESIERRLLLMPHFDRSFSISTGSFADVDIINKDAVSTEDDYDEDSVIVEKFARNNMLTFAFPALLVERECLGLVMYDSLERAFRNVTLTVEHNCKTRKSKSPMVLQLSDLLKINKFKHNLAEVRRLHINLGDYRFKQFSPLNYEYNIADSVKFENLAVPKNDEF
uniref:Secreted protein n=1 Tax=Globodera pallida TaxID=36090 RepID=A0A183C4I6_GLOPA